MAEGAETVRQLNYTLSELKRLGLEGEFHQELRDLLEAIDALSDDPEETSLILQQKNDRVKEKLDAIQEKAGIPPQISPEMEK